MRAKRLPRPAPPGSLVVWRHEKPGVGEFYMHGMIVRQGVAKYLVRVSSVGKNDSAVCLLLVDGTVDRWYSAWGERRAELTDVLESARLFVLADQVISS